MEKPGKSQSATSWLALACLLIVAPVVATEAEEVLWREAAPENLIFMDLPEGRVTIELNPLFAPRTVKQFRKLVREGFYDGLSFYRVIDGFVAQGGDGSDLGRLSNVPLIDAEFEIDWSEDFSYIRVQESDLFAAETGFIDGFATARDPGSGKVWLTHCPGSVAMARSDSADSSRTDFYIVIGQSPRYLDRNMNVFARVIHGMDVVQKIRRGKPTDNGIIQDETVSSRIRKMTLAADVPEEERLAAYVMDTASDGFGDLLDGRRNRRQKFFHNRPPQVLDVCQIPMAGRLTK